MKQRHAVVAAALMALIVGCGDTPQDGTPQGGFRTTLEPVITSKANDFGLFTTLALDENGDPLVAFAIEDENGDTNRSDSSVYFAGWDRARKAFLAPVKVGDMGHINRNAPHQNVALSRDATDGRLGIVWVRNMNEVVMATSADSGKSWSSVSTIYPVSLYDVNNVALGMAGGRIHLAFWAAFARCGTNHCGGTFYGTGTAASGITTQLVPQPSDYGDRNMPISIAIDSNNQPALAFFELSRLQASGYDTRLVYWRPGADSVVNIANSANTQNDTVSVSLAFNGTRPRVAFHLFTEANREADLKVSTSENGMTWTDALVMPREAEDGTDNYQSLAVDSKGRGVVVANFSTSRGAGECDGPKLYRSEDLRSWSVCGLDPTGQAGFGGRYVKAAFTRDDRLVVVFTHQGTENAVVKPGIVLWREE